MDKTFLPHVALIPLKLCGSLSVLGPRFLPPPTIEKRDKGREGGIIIRDKINVYTIKTIDRLINSSILIKCI